MTPTTWNQDRFTLCLATGMCRDRLGRFVSVATVQAAVARDAEINRVNEAAGEALLASRKRKAAKKARIEAARNAKPVRYISKSSGYRTGMIFREVTADDASIHGSQYLGLEGTRCWMPRAA